MGKLTVFERLRRRTPSSPSMGSIQRAALRPLRLVTGLLVVVFVGCASNPSASEQEDLLDVRIERDAPGCIVGAFDPRGIRFQRSFGLANLDAGMPIDDTTRFELGSTSKQFTALAILLLEADGLLRRSDPVGLYLPQLPEQLRSATLDQLIRHTSGIADYLHLARLSFGLAVAGLERRRTIELAAAVPLMFPAGTRHEYSNTGYVLLADVVQAVSGQGLGAFLHQRVFQPLGMNDTVVIQASRPSPRRAGYFAVRAEGVLDGEWRTEDGPGAWGVRSTLRDLERWNRAFLNDAAPIRRVRGAMEETALLPRGGPPAYAARLFVGSYRGVRAVPHGARTNIEFMRLPELGAAVAVLCARDDVNADLIAERVADRVFGDRLGPSLPVARTAEHRDLLGDFVSTQGNHFTIVDQDGTLFLEDVGPIQLIGDGRFTAGPSTDGLSMRRQGDGLRAQFVDEAPIHLERARFWPPTEAELRVLSGTFAKASLRAVVNIGSEGGSPSLALADGRRLPLVRLAPDLYAAGVWRIRTLGTVDGPAARISIQSRRTPQIIFSRLEVQ